MDYRLYTWWRRCIVFPQQTILKNPENCLVRGLFDPSNVNKLNAYFFCITTKSGRKDAETSRGLATFAYSAAFQTSCNKINCSAKLGLIPRRTTLKFEYLWEFEPEFENVLGYELGAHMGSIHEKNPGAKNLMLLNLQSIVELLYCRESILALIVFPRPKIIIV